MSENGPHLCNRGCIYARTEGFEDILDEFKELDPSLTYVLCGSTCLPIALGSVCFTKDGPVYARQGGEPTAIKRRDLLDKEHIGKRASYHGHEGILGKHDLLDIPVVEGNGTSLSIASGDSIEIEGVRYVVQSDVQPGEYEPIDLGMGEEPLIVDDISTGELRLKDDTVAIELDRIRKESERMRKALRKDTEDKYGKEAT